MIDLERLKAPFNPDEIEWRVGSTNQAKTRGMALAYIDARAVMDRLDEVCGPGNWQCRYPIANGKTCCEIAIKAGDEWVWKSDGAGDTDFEGAKGAFSDAFKRAAVRWGVGRFLYHLKAPWVLIEPMGKSFKISESELPKLRALIPGSNLPPVADVKPEGNPPGITKFRQAERDFLKEMHACTDYDEYCAFVRSFPAKNFVTTAMVEFPKDWNGDGGDIKGIKKHMEEFCASLKSTTKEEAFEL